MGVNTSLVVQLVQTVSAKEIKDVLRRVEHVLAELALRRQLLEVVVRHRARPAVPVVALAVVLHDALAALAVPADVLDERVFEDRLVRHCRVLVLRAAAVVLGEGVQDVDHGLLGVGLGVAVDGRSGVGGSVELEEWIALVARGGLAGAHAGDVVGVVVGTADGGKGREAAADGGIASNDGGEASAVGLAGTEDSVPVDAELLLDVVQQVIGEVEVVRARGVGLGVGQPVAILAVGIDGNAVLVELGVGELGQVLLLGHVLGGAMEGEVDRGRSRRTIVGGNEQAIFTVTSRQLQILTGTGSWEMGGGRLVASRGSR